jgi:hypothetical protein
VVQIPFPQPIKEFKMTWNKIYKDFQEGESLDNDIDPVKQHDDKHEDEEWDYLAREIERKKKEEARLNANPFIDPGY